MLFPVDAAELQALSRQLQQRTHVLQKTHQRQSTERTHTHTKLAVWALVAAVVASWLTPLLRELLTRTRWSDVLVVYLVVELAFFIYQRRRYWVANQVVHDLPEMPGGLTLTITDYLLSQDIPLQEFVEGWFHGAALDDIKRGNMLEFLAYGIFYSKFVALQDDEQQHLRDLLAYVECKLGYTFAQGYNTRLQFMAHLWQPLRSVHLPLCVYAATECIGLAADAALLCMGFTPATTPDGFRYMTYRPTPTPPHPRSTTTTTPTTAQQPILFLHGVLGLVGCVPLLWRLRGALPTRPMVVLDIRHVSMRLTLRGARTVDEVALAAMGALEQEGIVKADVVAHSYGTFVAARLVKSYPAAVGSLVLLEPVALLTCWPKLLSSFVYGQSSLEIPISIKAVVNNLRWLCSREQTMAETFCRRFYWSELTLWPQQLPERSLLVLSGKDDLVAAELVEKLCTAVGKGRLLCRRDGAHGDVLLRWQWQTAVLDAIVATVEGGVEVDKGE